MRWIAPLGQSQWLSSVSSVMHHQISNTDQHHNPSPLPTTDHQCNSNAESTDNKRTFSLDHKSDCTLLPTDKCNHTPLSVKAHQGWWFTSVTKQHLLLVTSKHSYYCVLITSAPLHNPLLLCKLPYLLIVWTPNNHHAGNQCGITNDILKLPPAWTEYSPSPSQGPNKVWSQITRSDYHCDSSTAPHERFVSTCQHKLATYVLFSYSNH